MIGAQGMRAQYRQGIEGDRKRRKQTMLSVAQVAGVSGMEAAIRQKLVLEIKRQLANGDIQSKYLDKIQIIGIISVKAYISSFKKNIGLTANGHKREFVLKMINPAEVEEWLSDRSGNFQEIIDKWIYVAPQTPHIVQAFEVFAEYNRYYQIMEFWPNSGNVFQYINNLNYNFISGNITADICKFAFQYVIQTAHALAIAHQNDLTHGQFNLGQVLVTYNSETIEPTFKVFSFRPWLVKKPTAFSKNLKMSNAEMLQIAKCKDLFDFGVSIFELMIGKKMESETATVVPSSSDGVIQSPHQFTQPQIMPYLDSLPLGWVKLNECASFIQVLHLSMVIDASQVTAQTFEQIKDLATQEYIKHFDPNFQPLPSLQPKRPPADIATALNNRASLLPIKMFNNTFLKGNSAHVNLQLMNVRSSLLEQALQHDKRNLYAIVNQIWDQWKRGQILDQDFCKIVQERLYMKKVRSQNSNILTIEAIQHTFSLAVGIPFLLPKIQDKVLTILLEELSEAQQGTDSMFTQTYSVVAHLQDQLKSQGYQLGYDITPKLSLFVEKKIEFANRDALRIWPTQAFQTPLDAPTTPGLNQDLTGHSQTLKQSNGHTPNKNSIDSTPGVVENDATAQGESSNFAAAVHQSSKQREPFFNNEEVEDEFTEDSAEQNSDLEQCEIEPTPQQIAEKQARKEKRDRRNMLCEVDQIVFSSNERFALLITQNQASLVEIHLNSIVLIKKIDLHNVWTEKPQTKFTWTGAVNNEGTQVVLHCRDEFSIKWRQNTVGRTNNDSCLVNARIMVTCPVWFWTSEDATQGEQFFMVDLGRCCPDEILEISFDQDEKTQKHDRLLNPVDTEKEAKPYLATTSSAESAVFKGQAYYSTRQHEGQATLQVKCKNLVTYGIQNLDDFQFGPKVTYQKEMAGGYADPKGLFRVQPSHFTNSPNDIPPTYDFTQTMDMSKPECPNWPMLKLSLYPYARAFIQKQELCGNIVQLCKYEPKYVYIHQTSTYKGRAPHIFIWNILSQVVVRRMHPFSEPYDLGVNVMSPLTSPTSQNPKYQAQAGKNGQIGRFEVSPHGTYMLCVVDGAFLCKKYLTGGVLKSFKKLMKGCFFEDLQYAKRFDGTFMNKGVTLIDPVATLGQNSVDSKTGASDTSMLKVSKRGHNSKAKQRLDSFLDSYTKYYSYQGSAAQKQVYMNQLYKQVAEVMTEPGKFIYDSQKASKQTKNIKKCMDILRDFHYYFSVESSQAGMATPYFNIYSHKTAVTALHKVQTFDKVAFARHTDQIRYFCLCSTLKNWFLAVFHARVLQIYDHLSGAQEYEINMPSCRGIHFLDQEQLIILEDGISNVFVCSIEMQKRTFQERMIKSKKKLDEVKTVKYEDDEGLLSTAGGNGHERRLGKQEDLDEVDYDELKDTAGVKVIRFDEDIRRVFCSRNTSPFGYIAIIGNTKMSIFLAYADEIVAMYDHIWTLNQWDLRMNNAGARVDLIDFTDSCENFVTNSCTGDLVTWSIKTKRFNEPIAKLQNIDMPWSQMRSIREDKMVIGYSRLQQKFVLVKKSLIKGIEAEVHRLDPSKMGIKEESFGECNNFQVDNTQKFIIAVFPSTSKLVVFNIDAKQMVLKVCRQDILFKHVWIDETGCFLATLNEQRNAVEIFIFEWKYDVKEPIKQLKQDTGLDEMQKQLAAEEAARQAGQQKRKKEVTKTCSIL